MIGISNIILLVLIDLTIEESRMNFLWVVIWQLALSLYLTTNWLAISVDMPFTMVQIFNYLSLSFIGVFVLTMVFMGINTLLGTSEGLTTLQIPLQFTLRHKIEIVVLGTLFFAFSSIGIMTYLIEHEESGANLYSLLELVKEQDSNDSKTPRSLSNVDTISLSTAIDSAAGLTIFQQDRLPYGIHQHFLTSETDTIFEQSLIRKISSSTVVQMSLAGNGFYQNYERSILSKLLNLYVFLFITAIGLIYLLAGQITRPLALLGQKLLDIDLGKENRRIEWKHNDELGHLIDQYNNMIEQLDNSAEVLAKNERDHAWKEMAKQVAHEIKNPLTPMKLTIQHLQMRAKSQSTGLDQHVARASSTLIEQIDNLVRIANNFSQFGKMPQATNDKILLNEVVTSVHDLFRKREDMDIKCFVPIDDQYVFADKDHLIRIFNNIIKNAIQAIPLDRKGLIVIRLKREHHDAIVSITDNGIGIPDDQKSKVFQPNFTTKSSGTGLGLAMCNKMINSMNGNISFETDLNNGSVFYVRIPLMRIDENFLPEAEEKVTTLL
jgi:signal transduction histidine kinase